MRGLILGKGSTLGGYVCKEKKRKGRDVVTEVKSKETYRVKE